eukprot:GHVN01042133.1.p1 GENE.GHVN01042133.1~~GHVN01042133.1.p1  ORF type:complete len:458 (-),score=122.67 GHVN01042133.1:197-1570(-)
MNRTVHQFNEMIQIMALNCFDCVGLLLMIKINQYNKSTMARRQIYCLDDYLDATHMTLLPRLKSILDDNILSLRTASAAHLMASPHSTSLTSPAADQPHSGHLNQKCHPHVVTRRYAQLTHALTYLLTWSQPSPHSTADQTPLLDRSGQSNKSGEMNASSGAQQPSHSGTSLLSQSVSNSVSACGATLAADQTVLTAMASMQTAMESLLSAMSCELNQSNRLVFLINNYYLLLTHAFGSLPHSSAISSNAPPSASAFKGTSISSGGGRGTKRYSLGGGDAIRDGQMKSVHSKINAIRTKLEDQLHDSVNQFVELILDTEFHSLLAFVRESEISLRKWAAGGESGGSRKDPVDLVKAEALAREFSSKWKHIVGGMRVSVTQAFTNLNNASDILKQAITQLALYYNRFQTVCHKGVSSSSPHSSDSPHSPHSSTQVNHQQWLRDLVPNHLIIAETRRLL